MMIQVRAVRQSRSCPLVTGVAIRKTVCAIRARIQSMMRRVMAHGRRTVVTACKGRRILQLMPSVIGHIQLPGVMRTERLSALIEVMLRRTELMMLRSRIMLGSTIVMRRTTVAATVVHRATAEATTMVHAPATETAAVVHPPATHMTATHMAATAHMTTTAVASATATMICRQIRTQTQNNGRCQDGRHPVLPGIHCDSSSLDGCSAVSMKYTELSIGLTTGISGSQPDSVSVHVLATVKE
jgi:hypothetical protein